MFLESEMLKIKMRAILMSRINSLVYNSDYSVVDVVDRMVHAAIDAQASDIHLEMQSDSLRVRFRIDGVLYDRESIPLDSAQQLITRIKILANINISQKRLPQDGKFQTEYRGNQIDCRIATFPSVHGEKVAIRILDPRAHSISLEKLGFSEHLLDQFRSLICKSHGMLLVTGPTGSGKSTTLYAALSAIHTPEKNIITLEDPVEYNIKGITQGQIHYDAGFTFERGIRALLRQDPDVAMIGEIRDKESARIAIEAALTGHLVLSTLHTNDAVSAVVRLVDMTIEPFLINAALSGVLAQRLVRKLCVQCKKEVVPNGAELATLEKLGTFGIDTFYKPVGCEFCFGTGYKGRIGIFELLSLNDKLRFLIAQSANSDKVCKQALQDGMTSMIVDGLNKLKQGIIPLSELVRVLH